MNTALIGYGRMGQTIEKILLERGHSVGLIIDMGDALSAEKLKGIDVAIEFTVPSAVENNLKILAENGIPTVCGTTGWLENYQEVVGLFEKNKGAFLYASNFSLGVNLFFAFNAQLAAIMQRFPAYSVSMEEIHHSQKLDAPSGTAITLAEGILENSAYQNWHLDQPTNASHIGIKAIRTPDVPGTHSIAYDSKIDSIEIKHTAHSREGFALGAVVAAEYVSQNKGISSMKDVLGLS